MRSDAARRFWFKLTMALGHASVAECQRAVSSREFVEWTIYDQLDPIGGRRLDLLFAQLCDIVCKSQGVKNTKAADFVPEYGITKKKKRPTGISIIQRMNNLIRGGNGKAE